MEPVPGAPTEFPAEPPRAGVPGCARLWCCWCWPPVESLTAVALNQSNSGASSPEAAVQRLVSAITNEDVLGVIAAIAPEEKESVRTSYDEAANGDATEQDLLKGVDVTATGVLYRTEQVADGVARVYVTSGTVGYHVERDQLDPQLRDLVGPDEPAVLEDSVTVNEVFDTPDAQRHAFVVAIKRGDQWYVSLTYTLAEHLRQDLDFPPPDPGTAVAKGATTPRGVVESLFGAVNGLDAARALDLLDPVSMRVVHDYRQAILDSVPDAQDISVQLTLDALDVDETPIGGDKVMVSVKHVAAHAVASYTDDDGAHQRDEASFEVTGKCATFSETTSGETDGPQTECLADDFPLDLNAFFVVVVKRDGGYYLDLFETFVQYGEHLRDDANLEDFLSDELDV